MELTQAQKLALIERGYVKIAGVVPPVMVRSALRAINHSVGEGMPPDEMTRFRAQTYCPELMSSEVITGLLLQTPAWNLAESAVGPGRLRQPESGQIALRFPIRKDPPPPPMPHLDGMYTPTNGVPEGTIGTFTMLVAVFLSEVAEEFAGNFAVWPGTHHLFERYFREHQPQSLLKGMPPVPLPEPEQLLVSPGDVALCHYQLAHTAVANVSPHVRYAVFFRLRHVDHESPNWEAMTDLWREWDGIRPLLPG